MRKAGVWGRRRINREKWQRRAKRFVLAGKTTRGTRRRVRLWTELQSHGPQRTLERDVLRYREMNAPHLLPSALEMEYSRFRAETTSQEDL